MSHSAQNLETIFSAPFWETVWDHLGNTFLADHQKRYPQRWSQFYENHGPLLREIGGVDHGEGCFVIEALLRQGMSFQGSTVVDLGCGSGWLALPLVLKGARVLAVDTSTRMLETLRNRAQAMGIASLKTLEASWTEIKSREPFDLVLAASFPPALCPDGISRMERLGKKCILLLPGSSQGLPWIKSLWSTLCDRNPFSGSLQLRAALNYLMAVGREPNLIQVRIPMAVDLPLDQVIDFYAGYFALFERCDPEVREIIQREIAPFTHEGRVHARGESHFGLIWWVPMP
ncbi:MAG: methyltransferase domain-containing protein [Pseudomonadota bacterium]